MSDAGPEKTVVQFRQLWKSYYPGEIAGFDPHQADKLIKDRVAYLYDVEAKKAVIPLEPAAPPAGAAPEAVAELGADLAELGKKDLVDLAKLAGIEVDHAATVKVLRTKLATELAAKGLTVAAILDKPAAPPAGP